jgi:hypothetical protein
MAAPDVRLIRVPSLEDCVYFERMTSLVLQEAEARKPKCVVEVEAMMKHFSHGAEAFGFPGHHSSTASSITGPEHR